MTKSIQQPTAPQIAVPVIAMRDITVAQLERDLSRVYRVAPFSEAALDVFEMTRRTNFSADQIAAAIQRAPWLAAEILARSNSSFYNALGEKISDLSQAVARIGQKKVGELALCSNALYSKSKQALHWMDPDLAWRRCIGAGVAIEYLVDKGDHYEVSEGLTLTATMHLSGRAALAFLYQREYESLLGQCRASNLPLVQAEAALFPMSHMQVLAELLKLWGIPSEIYSPLHWVLASYPEIAKLSEPLRTRVELMKLAVTLGEIAGGQWTDWDLVDLPPLSVLTRLGVHDLTQIVESTKRDANAIAAFKQGHPPITELRVGRLSQGKHVRTTPYEFMSSYPFDVLAHMMNSRDDLRLATIEDEPAPASVFNCLASTTNTRLRLRKAMSKTPHAFVCHKANEEELSGCGETISLPCGFGKLRDACLSRSVNDDDEAVITP